jgi:hypothetical protein
MIAVMKFCVRKGGFFNQPDKFSASEEKPCMIGLGKSLGTIGQYAGRTEYIFGWQNTATGTDKSLRS